MKLGQNEKIGKRIKRSKNMSNKNIIKKMAHR